MILRNLPLYKVRDDIGFQACQSFRYSLKLDWINRNTEHSIFFFFWVHKAKILETQDYEDLQITILVNRHNVIAYPYEKDNGASNKQKLSKTWNNYGILNLEEASQAAAVAPNLHTSFTELPIVRTWLCCLPKHQFIHVIIVISIFVLSLLGCWYLLSICTIMFNINFWVSC